jgi:hypothetical protein
LAMDFYKVQQKNLWKKVALGIKNETKKKYELKLYYLLFSLFTFFSGI